VELIDSESKFIWKIILRILMLPITFVMVLFGKKEFKELFEPIRLFFEFIFEAKLTITLIIINTAIFIWSAFWSDATINALIAYPSDLLSTRVYTLITAGFLHANITHLLGNMLVLFIFGRVVERKLGLGKTFLIYFGALIISGIFSSGIELLSGNNIPGLGASGAIMGLVAAAILLDPFYFTYELILPLPIMLIGWLTIYADIIGIINPAADGIGHFAHLGGFLSVTLLMFFLSSEDKETLKKGFYINIGSLIFFVAIYYLLSA
jgi:membrane associated rhomboid family serine protease